MATKSSLSRYTKIRLQTLNLSLSLTFYDNNRPAIVVTQNGLPYGKLSTNLPIQECEDNQFFAKTYSKNAGWSESLLSLSHYFLPANEIAYSGYAELPLYSITPDFINDQFEATYCFRTDIYEAHPQLWALYEKYCKGIKE